MAALTGDYQFSSEPRTVQRSSKYRDEEGNPVNSNIMYDKRVVRGNTYAAMIIPASAQQELQRQQEVETQKQTRMKALKSQLSDEPSREVMTPLPVEGRTHIEVQTEELVEVLKDKPEEVHLEAQTEDLIDRPPTPLFKPKKLGEDKETQIEQADPDLFDFQREVDPILEVLVTKCVEQARMEVLEEEEVSAIKKHKREFEQLRNAELIEVQRLEAQEKRRVDEIDRRRLQRNTRRELKREAHQKYVSRILAKKLMGPARQACLTALEQQGVFREPAVHAYDVQLIPWLVQGIIDMADDEVAVNSLIDQIMKDAYAQACRQYDSSRLQEIERQQQMVKDAEQKVKDDAQRRVDRVQLRIDREKRREIQALKDKIQAELINKCQSTDHVLNQSFSDVDGRQTTPVIGTPGGLFGEFLGMLEALEEVLGRPLTQEDVTGLLYEYVMHMKGQNFVYSNLKFAGLMDFLHSIDAKLSLESLIKASGDNKAAVLKYFLDSASNVPRTFLTLLLATPQDFGMREGLFEMMLTAVFKLATSTHKDDGAPNQAKNKIQFRPQNLDETGHEIAVVKVTLPPSRPGTAENKERDQALDRTLLIPPNNGDISVFVVHKPAQYLLRQELCNWLRTVKKFEEVDTDEVFAKMCEKGDVKEEKYFQLVAEQLPILEF